MWNISLKNISRDPSKRSPLYQRIYVVVRQIPAGQVATYGQVGKVVGRCPARVVGYAMAALPCDTDVPWHRVINRQGKISPRTSGDGRTEQRQLLEAEGVCFDLQARVDLNEFGWRGPPFSTEQCSRPTLDNC
ncbi:MAG: MGMT family protein [Candidatus Methylomirabilales bacterium]